MSFDQNMIIDATTGSIARFVNHSCSPNCRMIKWIVSGQPRMALFAGDRPIMSGDELTYDYNFDPFSAKNVQKCLCGSANCRGVLGPKPKEVKPPKANKEDGRKKKKKKAKGAEAQATASKASAQPAAKTATKRKLKDAFEVDVSDEENAKTVKKPKIKPGTGLKKTLSAATLKGAKGAVKGAVKGAAKGAIKGVAKGAAKGVAKGAAKGVTKIKRSVASVSVAAKKKTKAGSKVTKAKLTKAKVTVKKTVRKGAIVKKTAAATKAKKTATLAAAATTTTTVTTTTTTTTTTATAAVAQAKPKLIQTKIVFPSRSPSLTIVAAGVSGTPPILTDATTTPTADTPPTPLPATATANTPQSSSSAPKALAKLTFSSGGRRVTPSRKAMESGLVAGSPVSMKPATKIKLINTPK